MFEDAFVCWSKKGNQQTATGPLIGKVEKYTQSEGKKYPVNFNQNQSPLFYYVGNIHFSIFPEYQESLPIDRIGAADFLIIYLILCWDWYKIEGKYVY